MRRIYTAIAIASLACVAVFSATFTSFAGADPGALFEIGPPDSIVHVLMLGTLALAAFSVAVSAVSLAGILVHVLRRPRGIRRRRMGMIPLLRLASSPPAPHLRC